MLPQAGTPTADALSPRSTLSRPVSSPYLPRFTGPLSQGGPRLQSPLRTRRLISDAQYREQAQRGSPPYSSQQPSSIASQARIGLNSSSLEVRLLMPGTILHGGRYRLLELRSRQEWARGAFEAMWIGQDAQRAGSQVVIWEVVLPEMASSLVQSKLRSATVTLASVGRHPHIPALWDAFSDQERAFFIFEPIAGESLLARMQRTGRALPEQDVIACCRQITEVLELLAQQMPPLVHGLIRPEHIIATQNGSLYMFTNFSIVMISGATQFITGIERSRLSPYMAPELARGVVDTRSDLYSLLATAYHVVTGSVPAEVDGNIPQVQRLNPNVSARFGAILAKGLHPIASQRYQRPSELLQDLLSIRAESSSLGSRRRREWSGQVAQAGQPAATDSISKALPMLLTPTEDLDEQAQLLPRPEELPALEDSNDTRNALILLALLVLCIIAVVVASGRPF
jgi:serine/threonine protein kinase